MSDKSDEPGVEETVNIRNGVQLRELSNGAMVIAQPREDDGGVWLDRLAQQNLYQYLRHKYGDEGPLTITVNGGKTALTRDFGSSPEEFLSDIGFDPERYVVYRNDWSDEALVANRKVREDDLCSEPMIVTEGDEFVVMPEFVMDG